jgi:hypothetical protein
MKIAQPLPECRLCEVPTRRDSFDRNGGLCTDCAHGIAATVRMLPVRDTEDLERQQRMAAARHDEDALTVQVERWLPPVPGER